MKTFQKHYHGGLAAIALFILLGCSESLREALTPGPTSPDSTVPSQPTEPIVPGCTPQAFSDAGADKYIVLDDAAEFPDFATIGSPALAETSYEWTPAVGLDNPKSSQPLASPASTQVYTLTATTRCGSAKSAVTVHVLKSSGDQGFETVKAIDKFGVAHEYPTGYEPGHQQYYRAQFRNFQAKLGKTAVDPIPVELDLKTYAQRVFRQECGDCWFQGAVSMFETLVSLVDKVSTYMSRQHGIDCSGFGSCGGGQISVAHFKKPKGSVSEPDYPYVGRTQRCRPGAPLQQAAEDSFFVRDITVPSLQRAIMESGPLEVCGAASALGNGGWISKNGGGAVNHCWAMLGWYDGAKHGKPEGVYAIFLNSWGESWGDGGYAYVKLAKDGVNLDGNVLTEAAGVVYKPACTPQPHADAGPDKTILKIPGMSPSVRIGTPGKEGQVYSWSPDGAPVAQPIVSPAKTTSYTVTARTMCGETSATMTVRVYQDVNGRMTEVRE